jgi:hypothetical protein
VPYATQTDFKMEDLAKIEDYRGLPQMNSKIDWENLFQVLKNNQTLIHRIKKTDSQESGFKFNLYYAILLDLFFFKCE